MKKMTVEEVKQLAIRNLETKAEFEHMPLQDIVLIYQVKPDKAGLIDIPEHLKEKAKGVVFVICAVGPDCSEHLQPGLEATVGSGGDGCHADMEEGFFLVSQGSFLSITNERWEAPAESGLVLSGE